MQKSASILFILSDICGPFFTCRFWISMDSTDVVRRILAAGHRCPLLDFPSLSMSVILLGYLSLLALFELFLPGQRVPGVLLWDGTRRYYKCNGLLSMLLLLALLGINAKMGFISLLILAEKGGQLFVTTLLCCLVVSLLLYINGSKSKSRTASAKPCVTSNRLHDWWFGVQLNPQFLWLDLKFFWIKAGMIGWLLVNLSIAAVQSKNEGSLTLSMCLYQSFCAVYILDYFWFEEYITSTWDIIAEKFGFMLIFGDLVWIPFIFSVQGWWLLRHKVELTRFAVALNVLTFLIGFAVFRGANRQKHIFKKDPTVAVWGKPPKIIGGKLLCSGYWGVARHCNYLGDILLAFSFSLPCGASSIVPYFYPLYLLLLLLWRERRDEAKCREKYKDDWVEYCRVVPWRIFPYIY